MKIYTRTGDKGTTSLFSGGRVPKYHLQVETYGLCDELGVTIARAAALVETDAADQNGPAAEWQNIFERCLVHQTNLFRMGSLLAGLSPDRAGDYGQADFWNRQTADLEGDIDHMQQKLPELTNFILSGGSPEAVEFHTARTACRRLERNLVRLGDEQPEFVTRCTVLAEMVAYINRLSDTFFVLARYSNHLTGRGDTICRL